jgi:hypothetical protein
MPAKPRLARFTCQRCSKIWQAAPTPLPVCCPRCDRLDWRRQAKKPKRPMSSRTGFL